MKMKKIIAVLLSIAMSVGILQSEALDNAWAYEGQPLGTNVAYNRTVTLPTKSNVTEQNDPSFMTDGDSDTGYQGTNLYVSDEDEYADEQDWILDLGKVYEIDYIKLVWEAAGAQVYNIYVSETGKDDTWQQIVGETDGTEGTFKYRFKRTEARYVKLELKRRCMSAYGYKLLEIQVFTVGSVEDEETENLALKATATASADDGENPASNAIDGNYSTIWRTKIDESKSDEQRADEYITLAWDEKQTITTVKIKWKGGYMTGYKLQVSDDGETWEDVAEIKNGKSSQYRTVQLENAVETAYLRLQGVTFGAYCFEVAEIEVYDESQIQADTIYLSYDVMKLNLDDEEQITKTINYNVGPSNAADRDVVWSCDDTDVATVEEGVVTGVSQGSCKITATLQANPAVAASCTVIVSKELEKSVVTATGNNKDITVEWTEVENAGSYILTRYNVFMGTGVDVYTGSDTKYVDEGLSSGTYRYYVTAVVDEYIQNSELLSNSKSQTTANVVVPEDVTGIQIYNSYSHIDIYVGEQSSIQASVLPTNATNTGLLYESINEDIVTVDEEGNVTGINPGNGTVTVTTQEGGYSAEVTVHVEAVAISSFTAVGDESITMETGETRQLQVDMQPENVTYKDVTWKSSNTKAATVDETGKVTAMADGTATITATAMDGRRVSFTVTVKTTIQKIKLNVTSKTIIKGETFNISATITPSSISNENIYWISSNPSVATVDNYGCVTGEKEGTAYISAKSSDGTVSATCTVVVTKASVSKPGKVKLKKIKTTSAKKKAQEVKATIKWKNAGDAEGYVIYIKTGKKAYKAVKTINRANAVKYTVRLERGKTYRVRMRAFKKDGETKVYGAYSKAKKIKVK